MAPKPAATATTPTPVFTQVDGLNAPASGRGQRALAWWGIGAAAVAAGVALAGYGFFQAPLWSVAAATGATLLVPPTLAKTADGWRAWRRARAARTLHKDALVRASERALHAWVAQPGFPTIDGTWMPIAQWSCTDTGFDLTELAFGVPHVGIGRGDGPRRMRAQLGQLPAHTRHLPWEDAAPDAGRTARKRLVKDDGLWAARGPKVALDTQVAITLLVGRLDPAPLDAPHASGADALPTLVLTKPNA
jgi:hypothetical protein